jgi:GPH family glycoside/pentoside/hexuronide:cation symporter
VSTPLSTRTLAAYAAPAIGFGFFGMLTSTYLMKYATDTLAIPAAAMGGLLLVSRLWDGFADPVAGFLSDRTHSRLGRRRPWLLSGAAPLALTSLLLWCPPASLPPLTLVVWVGAAALLSFTAQTAVRMPHEALGAELSRDYHERNRVFAARRFAFGIGAFGVFAALRWVSEATDARAAMLRIVAPLSALGAALVVASALALREPAAHAGRGARRPHAALRHLLANPHARLLLSVSLLQQIATGLVMTSAAYHTEYVLADAGAFSLLLGTFFAATLASIPVWLRLARHFEKKPLLVASMASVGAILGAMFAVGRGDHALLFSLAALGGFAAGGLDVLLPSLQADVVDWDELQTGERKEGVYFAAWHLVEKLGVGIAGAIIGGALSLSGFAPHAEQSAETLALIRGLMSLFPLACYGAGALLFLRFGLDRRAHAEVQRGITQRARSAVAEVVA